MAISRKRKIIIGVSIAVLVILGIVVTLLTSGTKAEEVTIVKVERKKDLRSTVTASGEIRPIQFINLTSEVQGRIEEIYVQEGQRVEKEQPLVRLDPTQLQSSSDAAQASYLAAQSDVQSSRSQVTAAQNQYSQAQQGLNVSQIAVETARQNVIAAQTDVDKAQVELNAANRELKRNEELLEARVISRMEYDTSKDRVENAKVSLNNAKSRLDTQRLTIKDANARLAQQQSVVKDAKRAIETANYSADSSANRANQQMALLTGTKTLRDKSMQLAPINGVVADIPSKVGTFAVANLSSTPLLTIADMSTINVEVKVDETEIDKVAEGQAVKIKVDAFGDKEINGEVKQKTPLAVGKSQTSGGLSTQINVQEAKEFKVVIEIKDAPDDVREGLRPGMSATATITTKTVENVFTVPLQAVIEKKPEGSPSPTIQGDSPQPSDKPKPIKGVYILDGNKAKFVEVETGITGESDIQITGGINEGDEVITGPSRVLNTLKDGTIVKKQEKKEGEGTPKT